jgi:spermidine/putrescine transport system ATP-binding protein
MVVNMTMSINSEHAKAVQVQNIAFSIKCGSEQKHVSSTTQVKSCNWPLADEIIGVNGPSGAGKTTLLKQIAGLLDAQSIALQIDGKDYTKAPAQDNPCCYVGADSPLFVHLSLRDNLLLTCKLSTWRSLQTLGIEQVIALCELEEFVERSASLLSEGEKQRGQIARALLSGKPVLLLDEALSAMDWPLRARMHKRLLKLCRDGVISIVMVSHSLRELASCTDTLMQLKQGEVVAQNKTASMISDMLSGDNVESRFSVLEISFKKTEAEFFLDCFVLSKAGHCSEQFVYIKSSEFPQQTQKVLIQAQSVVLSKQADHDSSMLNCLRGIIVGIDKQHDYVEVSLNVEHQTLIAHISHKSLLQMQLSIGDPIFSLFKAI